MDAVQETGKKVLEALDKVVVGYKHEKKLMLAALLARGHVLLEGVPGIAKTTLVRALARALGVPRESITINGVPFRGFVRIQFTPDLMPSDVTGSLIYNPATREFEPKLGPIFAYIVLADEINRATPRTQAALLEAMQEKQVTIGGCTYALEDLGNGKFFMVAATQNPVEQEGTYPLPEAQLDRFIIRMIMGYPETLEEEKLILKLHAEKIREPVEGLEAVTNPSWVIQAQKYVASKIEVPERTLDYITRLVRFTRPEQLPQAREFFELGASPRGAIALLRMAKAWAFINGSLEADIEDVDAVLYPTLNHRVIPRIEKVLEAEEKYGRYSARYIIIAEGLEFVRKNAK